MASKFVVFAAIAIILPAVAMATEYVVGDGEGWKVGPNYTQWASGKMFYVGDTLVFQYQAPHNVYKVDGNGFKDCTPSQNLLNSGNDTITLAQPGKKWYICGFSDHCSKGQKLVINVMSNGPMPAPGPAPSGSYRLSAVSSYYKIVAAALLLMGFIAI
ncbi:blue copper protein-like [Euphorbia lathyris]|uniref:blue copper protein-like n=1 Tax=Euphorbia lathyris TaxID=212925 RepID=UPI0033139224